MHLHIALPIIQRTFQQSIDLFYLIICHCVTAYGDTVAMYHKKRACTFMCAVIFVWITQVKREVKFTVWVELVFCDFVKTFRRLFVSLFQLGPQTPGVGTDTVLFQELILCPGTYPYFQA